MTDPIHRLNVQLEPTPVPTRPGGDAAFTDALADSTAQAIEPPETRDAPPALRAMGDALRALAQDERRVERALRRARRGTLEPGALLALQTDVYRYTQEMELASKLVDKATSAVKTTLQSQQ